MDELTVVIDTAAAPSTAAKPQGAVSEPNGKPYAMLLLPKMVVSVPAVQGESKKKESKRLERQRRERMVLLAVLAVAAGFAYLCFASMQGTNGFHKVYPYVSVWS